MRKSIVPYPRINSSEALKRLDVKINWALRDDSRELCYEEIGNGQYRITDKDWYPDVKPLEVVVSIEMKNPHRLFDGVHGNDGCAVAARSSILGVALKWRLPKTDLQGAYHCKDISISDSGNLRFKAKIDFPASVIRFALILDLVVYLKNTSDRASRNIYAKALGSILGPLDRFVLVTGGSGGYFPTVTEKIEGGPLWKVHANISETDDFKEEFCADYFCLILNELHPLYDKVYVTSRDGKLYVSPLMFEIFVNACVILIQKACKYIPDDDWHLVPGDKDEQTIYVNFKSLKAACLPEASKKEILEMDLEILMLAVRTGLAKCLNVDLAEDSK